MPVLEKESLLKGSDAFRWEYDKTISDQILYDDIVSYLGEYRFKLSKYCYSLKFGDGKLRDPNRNDSMEELSQRAIKLKNREGKSSIRERAELKGFQNLDAQLRLAKTGDTIIWISPPGSKTDGYGNYGFVFFGKVEKLTLGEKNIKMTAMRVESSDIKRFQKSRYMLTQEPVEYGFAEEFLESPKVIEEDLKEGFVEAILKKIFNFNPNEEEQEMFTRIIDKMLPLTSEFIGFAKNPGIKKQEVTKAFHSLENYFLELKGSYKKIVDSKTQPRFSQVIERYGYEPPKAAGSCGSTANIFNSLSPLNSFLPDKYGSLSFKCPSCGKTNIREENQLLSQCQHCGSKDISC